MTKENQPLRINIGFIIHEDVGFTRTFDFSFPSLRLDADLTLSHAAGEATFTRTQEGILAFVHFSGSTAAECARCLDPATLQLDSTFTELYTFGHRKNPEADLILPEHGQIDLAPLLREYLLLELPINPLCKPDCLGLCPRCGKNLNRSPHTHKEDSIDPRMAVLKDLLKTPPKKKPAPAKKPSTPKAKAGSTPAAKKKSLPKTKPSTTKTASKKKN